MTVFVGTDVFDGSRLHKGASLLVKAGRVEAILPAGAVTEGQMVRLPGGVISPGFVDLQVNGGGGWQVDGNADAGRLAALCALHGRLGATGILPTLITDTPAATARGSDPSVFAMGVRHTF